jgi:hypothetical protein
MMLEAKIKELIRRYDILESQLKTEKKKKVREFLRKELNELSMQIRDEWVGYMNLKYAFVSDPQILIFDRQTGKIIPQNSLKLLLDNLQLPFDPVNAWIKHPGRLTFRGVCLSRNNNDLLGKFNLFAGWNCEPKERDCSSFCSPCCYLCRRTRLPHSLIRCRSSKEASAMAGSC